MLLNMVKCTLLFCSYRFTQIAVDPQVKVPGGKTYDVLFIGTGKTVSTFNFIEFLY